MDTTENKSTERERSHRHDKGYKDTLSRKDLFLLFLRKYVNEPWVKVITIDDIELVSSSFISQNYKYLDSDLIYKVKCGNNAVCFYVLLEMQSKVDFTMPFRILEYTVEILRYEFNNTDKNVRESKDYRLPAVVPIVFYNGEDRWTAVRSFREYTERGDIFGDNIIDFRYHLFDLGRVDEETLMSAMTYLDAMLALDKHRIKKNNLTDMATRLMELSPKLKPEDVGELFRWMSRLFFPNGFPVEVGNELLQTIKKGEINAMRHSLEIAVDEFREDAREAAKIEVAKRMLRRGVDVDTIASDTDLTVDDVLKLKSEGY